MTCSVIPFRPFDNLLSRCERRQVATWCAFRGPAWSADVVHTSTGGKVLGLATPSSKEMACGVPRLAWVIKRTRSGLVLIDMATCTPVGTFASVGEVLAAVARVEGEEAINDNEAA